MKLDSTTLYMAPRVHDQQVVGLKHNGKLLEVAGRNITKLEVNVFKLSVAYKYKLYVLEFQNVAPFLHKGSRPTAASGKGLNIACLAH